MLAAAYTTTLRTLQLLGLGMEASQMLLKVLVVLQPTVAVLPGTLDAGTAIAKVRSDVLLKGLLAADFLGTNVADVGGLQMAGIYVYLQDIFIGKSTKD